MWTLFIFILLFGCKPQIISIRSTIFVNALHFSTRYNNSKKLAHQV